MLLLGVVIVIVVVVAFVWLFKTQWTLREGNIGDDFVGAFEKAADTVKNLVTTGADAATNAVSPTTTLSIPSKITGFDQLSTAAGTVPYACANEANSYKAALIAGGSLSDNQLNDRRDRVKEVLTRYADCINEDLKLSQYKHVCDEAIRVGIQFGDDVPHDGKATSEVDDLKSKIRPVDANFQQLPSLMSQTTNDTGAKLYRIYLSANKVQDVCQTKIDNYASWQNQLDKMAEQPCPAEPTIQLPGQKDIQDSALKNADALQDIMNSLDVRIAAIQQKIKDNKVKIGPTTYSDLILDVTDKNTFDFSLHGTTPVISVIGSEPQKLKLVLPQGPAGPQGPTGPPGPDYPGLPVQAQRGPRGESSHFSGLPEQWSS
jgi:hypothetical protein